MESTTMNEYIWEISLRSSTGQVRKVKILSTGVGVYECRFNLVNKILNMTSRGIVCFVKNYGKPLDLFYESEAIAKKYEYYPIHFSLIEHLRNIEPQLSENYKRLNVFAKPFTPKKFTNNW